MIFRAAVPWWGEAVFVESRAGVTQPLTRRACGEAVHEQCPHPGLVPVPAVPSLVTGTGGMAELRLGFSAAVGTHPPPHRPCPGCAVSSEVNAAALILRCLVAG